MPTVQVLDAKGKQAGTLELKADVFGVEIRGPLLHQAVVRELADRRAGPPDTKGRREGSGGGGRPGGQKATGRARQGSIRATQWKGGGKPFGPTPRSYRQEMPRAMRREALRAAVAGKLAGRQPAGGRAARRGRPVAGAARNVPWLDVATPSQVSVYQVLAAHRVVFERAGLVALEEALAR